MYRPPQITAILGPDTKAKHLGEGLYGVVWRISNREVLKVTYKENEGEVNNALYILYNWHPAFPVVSRVYFDLEAECYVIIKEEIDNAPEPQRYDASDNNIVKAPHTQHMTDFLNNVVPELQADDAVGSNIGCSGGFLVWRDFGEFKGLPGGRPL